MPFPNYCGRKRLWTRERVLQALNVAAREIQGPLPCYDHKYNLLKKGKLHWPSSGRILEYFHSLGRAWLAAGVLRGRVSLHNIAWLEKEDDYLLQYAGEKTLPEIATQLHRTTGAVRARLNRNHGIAARHNQGYLSAAEVAKEYGCSYHRIRAALKQGHIRGRFDSRRHRWEIDMLDILQSPAAQAILNAPKRTHKTWPTDVGNYYSRHGLKRVVRDGVVVRTVVKEPVCVGT